MHIKTLTENDVVFEISPLPEFECVEDYFEDVETIRLVKKLMMQTDWGWCCIEVKAKWGSFSGVSYLGACSYNSQTDFENDVYAADLKCEALNNLNDTIRSLFCELKTLEQEESVSKSNDNQCSNSFGAW